jgi:hypothetical protein
MKNPLVSLLLACCMASCQSPGSRIPHVEARQGTPISVSLKACDRVDLKVWETCHSRAVWFDVKDSQGKSAPHILNCVFWADTPEADRPQRDATEFKILVKKEKDAFLIGKQVELMYGRRIENPGAYLLEFHVDCYDRKHRLLYSGTAGGIRCHISNRTFLGNQQKGEGEEVTLLVRREK